MQFPPSLCSEQLPVIWLHSESGRALASFRGCLQIPVMFTISSASCRILPLRAGAFLPFCYGCTIACFFSWSLVLTGTQPEAEPLKTIKQTKATPLNSFVKSLDGNCSTTDHSAWHRISDQKKGVTVSLMTIYKIQLDFVPELGAIDFCRTLRLQPSCIRDQEANQLWGHHKGSTKDRIYLSSWNRAGRPRNICVFNLEFT